MDAEEVIEIAQIFDGEFVTQLSDCIANFTNWRWCDNYVVDIDQ